MKNRRYWIEWLITAFYIIVLAAFIYPFYFNDSTLIYIPLIIITFIIIRFKPFWKKGLARILLYYVVSMVNLVLIGLLFSLILNVSYFDILFTILMALGVGGHVLIGDMLFKEKDKVKSIILASLTMVILMYLANILHDKGYIIDALPYFYILIIVYEGVLFFATHKRVIK